MKLIQLLALILISQTALADLVAVKPGELYRSNQLVHWDMEDAITVHGIKTVINLRGENPNEKWWRQEKAVMDKHGINFVNIPMGAKTIPSRENLIALLETFKHAPRPILIHCQAGVDRTGEAVAIYEMTQWNRPKDKARRSIFPSLQKSKWYFFDEVFQGMDWAYTNYFPCQDSYDHFDRSSCIN